MLTLFATSLALAFPECDDPMLVEAGQPPVLDAWTRELRGSSAPPRLGEMGAVIVDETWPGRVEPELRSSEPDFVTASIGPESLRAHGHSGWDTPYGCLVLGMAGGLVRTIGAYASPCARAIELAAEASLDPPEPAPADTGIPALPGAPHHPVLD